MENESGLTAQVPPPHHLTQVQAARSVDDDASAVQEQSCAV